MNKQELVKLGKEFTEFAESEGFVFESFFPGEHWEGQLISGFEKIGKDNVVGTSILYILSDFYGSTLKSLVMSYLGKNLGQGNRIIGVNYEFTVNGIRTAVRNNFQTLDELKRFVRLGTSK